MVEPGSVRGSGLSLPDSGAIGGVHQEGSWKDVPSHALRLSNTSAVCSRATVYFAIAELGSLSYIADASDTVLFNVDEQTHKPTTPCGHR